MTKISRIEKMYAADAVCDQLVRLIKTGEIEVGGRLPAEHEMAEAFGVSRPVVREALGRLRAMGLVVSRPGSGSFVAQPGAQRPPVLGLYSVTELHEARMQLEIPAAGLAAERREEPQLGALARIVESMRECRDTREWVGLDAAFHVALADATRNRVLARLIEHLRELLIDQASAVLKVEGRLEQANAEHQEIFDAIAAQDPLAARQAMSTHLLNVYRI
jgi:GntR family transcriptional repressor for pyruvate dehydrogenase complex